MEVIGQVAAHSNQFAEAYRSMRDLLGDKLGKTMLRVCIGDVSGSCHRL